MNHHFKVILVWDQNYGKDDFGITGNTNVWPMLDYQKN